MHFRVFTNKNKHFAMNAGFFFVCFFFFTNCLVWGSKYLKFMMKSQPRSLWEFGFVFHSQGDNYRKRLFIVFKPFWLSLSCILYSHKVPISDTSFGKCLESHASFNSGTPLGWTGKCMKQRCCTILRKMQIGKLLVIWCCWTIPPPPPKHPSTPVLVVESYAVLRTGRAFYMQARSSKDSTETDACQR